MSRMDSLPDFLCRVQVVGELPDQLLPLLLVQFWPAREQHRACLRITPGRRDDLDVRRRSAVADPVEERSIMVPPTMIEPFFQIGNQASVARLGTLHKDTGPLNRGGSHKKAPWCLAG